ncbi:response regulator transcription factor [Pontibacter burrus]|uniref:Helix-turn-helix transcriptional regulator n=1 Tax=Pontibacter burrus TaxID=2704466 RepID=A0A6B3LW38_9BACT|nr:helix-turn-helix transcriptional regulator [Pontibacter burrus]NEM97651.1 helix-turn-helix transcriptional regulator [Pontibacter burrus]
MERHTRLLSRRECKIIELLAEGRSEADISRELGLPDAIVKRYLYNMLQKKGFVNSYQLICWAYKESILS